MTANEPEQGLSLNKAASMTANEPEQGLSLHKALCLAQDQATS